jgi:LmbE family N-acetylglucosaminyl deacetylase
MTSYVISPHLDDAVLSLGQYLAAADDVTIVTVFAGTPEPGTLTAYDAARGYETSGAAVRDRWVEDTAACVELGCRYKHLPFLDAQYGKPSNDGRVIAALSRYVNPEVTTYVPVGIGHPDHEQVARCARAVCRNGWSLRLYEELPYRVLHPEQVVDALAKVRAEGFEVGDLPVPLGVGDRWQKEAAIEKYRSQFPQGADDPCVLVPERVWEIFRPHPVPCD